jgi:DNA repair protein RecN (Recombination protein N)
MKRGSILLKLLHIENIAVVEKADIEFSSGLNVLTGETGAGKSIVIDALSAITGARTSRDVIRTGTEFAFVTAVFSGGGDAWITDNGFEADESGDIFLSRKITADGKNVCRINGAPVSGSQLRDLGATLLDIHGQNDGRKLLDEGSHLDYLDIYAGHSDTLSAYQIAYKSLKEKKSEIKKLAIDEAEKERLIDTLKHQIEEIQRAKLRLGEQDELASRRELLLNASKLTESVSSAFESLYGGENSDGAIALIADAQTELERAARYSDDLQAISQRLLDLSYSAQDISDELRDFREGLDFAPGELDELEARLDVLKRIERKYGKEEDALNHLERSLEELSNIEDSANRLSKLEKELEACAAKAVAISEKLSKMRKKAAKVLQKQVMDELAQLNMPGVAFLVEFDGIKDEYGLCDTGCDEARFLMSANQGEAPGRINRVASGGELARIMLALKNVLTSDAETGSMVFDEIDTGVSGIAARRVGEKLSKLALNRQVLCVTHLPQIAAMADAHFEISKSVSEGRTFTLVRELDFEGKKNEIARLTGGEAITETALAHAEEQLKSADEFKKNSESGIRNVVDN